MAISLARGRRVGATIDIGRKQAREYEAQAARAKKRGFFSGILGKGLGSVLGTGVVGALGLTGFGVPLAMALGSMAGKKGAYELTRGMGADASKISESDMYGFGRESGKTLRGDLKSQMVVDPLKEKGGFGKELLSSTLSAGLADDLGGATKSLIKGDVGKAFVDPKAVKGWAGAKESIGSLIPGFSTEGAAPEVRSPLHPEDMTKGEDYQGLLFEQAPELGPIQGTDLPFPEWARESDTQPSLWDEALTAQGENSVNILDVLGAQGEYAQGGQVVEQQQLLQLLALASMQQQEAAYDNTPLEEVEQPTIAERFASQGKTLGGNDIQSLSQKLGR